MKVLRTYQDSPTTPDRINISSEQYGYRIVSHLTATVAATVLVSCVLGCQQSADTKTGDLVASSSEASSTDADGPSSVYIPNPQPVEEQPIETLAIGADAPAFRLPGVDDRYWELNDFSESEALVVLFTCNHCPTAQAYEARMIAVEREYRDRGVAVVAISSTSPPALLPEECGYTDLDDTFDAMKQRAVDREFEFPYLYDGDRQEAALAYGPVATPHAFVFDSQRKLRYAGRLDDKESPAKGGQAEDLRAALDAVLAGDAPKPSVTKTFGCSIKWAWKQDYRKKVDADWAAKPVTLERVGAQGVADLLANHGEKLRLVNIWATTCGPCIVEMPDLVEIQRYYGDRSFELVLLSGDQIGRSDAVQQLLEKKQAAVRNLIWEEDDPYALLEAIGPDWKGDLPYTLLIAPGGEVVYRHAGPINPLEIRRAIVDHPLIGRFF